MHVRRGVSSTSSPTRQFLLRVCGSFAARFSQKDRTPTDGSEGDSQLNVGGELDDAQIFNIKV